MSQTPLVSVVIPAFNAAETIGQAIESLRAQTQPNFEAIIVDDGSADDTPAIARRFCEMDSRFTLIQQPNGGASIARNRAIEKARGEFIALLDADDVWLPEKLQRQMELFSANPQVNFAFANFFVWDGHRDAGVYYRAHRPLPDGDVGRQLVFSSLFGISTVVVKRAAFGDKFLFDVSLRDGSEDWDLWLRLAEDGLFARGTRQSLVRYRRWTGNMSNLKLKMAVSATTVLEKNFHATRRRELRPLYRHSLNLERGKTELVRARQFLNHEPEKIPAAIWRAWRACPSQIKWLVWFAFIAWPKFLGGRVTEKIVRRKLIEKF